MSCSTLFFLMILSPLLFHFCDKIWMTFRIFKMGLVITFKYFPALYFTSPFTFKPFDEYSFQSSPTYILILFSFLFVKVCETNYCHNLLLQFSWCFTCLFVFFRSNKIRNDAHIVKLLSLCSIKSRVR